jgi:hypothetical protein
VRGDRNGPRLLSLVKVCLLVIPPYVAGPHSRADKFVPRHFSDGFGQLPFVYGDPLANQLDGFFLIGFVRKEIPHDSRLSLGIETRDPDVPSCCHSWHYAPELSWVNGWQLVNSSAVVSSPRWHQRRESIFACHEILPWKAVPDCSRVPCLRPCCIENQISNDGDEVHQMARRDAVLVGRAHSQLAKRAGRYIKARSIVFVTGNERPKLTVHLVWGLFGASKARSASSRRTSSLARATQGLTAFRDAA